MDFTSGITFTGGITFQMPAAAGGGVADKGIFGYGTGASDGQYGAMRSMTNLVSNTGTLATDTTGVGTARMKLAAGTYGGDKAFFAYGAPDSPSICLLINLVSNTGVVATDTSGPDYARLLLSGAGYGGDKGIIGYGATEGTYGSVVVNLVSNTGVFASATFASGTSRRGGASTGYGTDKAIFGYGINGATFGTLVSITNLVSNTGVVATDTTGVGTARCYLTACGYGTDKAIFAQGSTNYANPAYVTKITNLVSNTGVVASDTNSLGSSFQGRAATTYGTSGEAMIAYGETQYSTGAWYNLISNTGTIASEAGSVGTSRSFVAGAAY